MPGQVALGAGRAVAAPSVAPCGLRSVPATFSSWVMLSVLVPPARSPEALLPWAGLLQDRSEPVQPLS